jgi:hypothetical protein
VEKFLKNLQRQAEENPILALGVAAGLIGSISKLVDSTGNLKNAHSWKQEVKRRAKKDARKY